MTRSRLLIWKPDADERNFEYTRTLLQRVLNRPPPDKAAARERNATTMFEAAWDQVHYRKQVAQGGSSFGMEDLFKLRGLKNSPRESPEDSDLFQRPPPANGDSEYDAVVDSLAKAVSPTRLQQKQGVMFTLGVENLGTHSVALYRSKGGHLYFFDANSGVYKVNQPREFLAAWKAACETRWGKKLKLDSKAESFLYITSACARSERVSNTRPRPA